MNVNLTAALAIATITLSIPAIASAQNLEALENREFQPIAPTNDFLHEAIELVDRLEDRGERVRLLCAIAIEYAELSQVSEAQTLLTQALDLTETSDDDRQMVDLLNAIAQTYLEIGAVTDAEAIADRAFKRAQTLENSPEKAAIFTRIALTYRQLGSGDRAAEILALTRSWFDTTLAENPPLFPFEATPLQGNLGMSSTLFSGSQTTHLLAIELGLEQQWPRDEFDTRFSFINDYDDSRTGDEPDNQLTAQLDAEYRHHFSERWQYFVNHRLRRDEPDNIDVRTHLYSGPGMNLWRAGRDRSFDIQLGLGIRYEDSSGREQDFDAAVTQYRLRYKDIFWDSLQLRQFLTVEFPLAELEDYYIESSTNFRLPIFNRWAISNWLRLRYSEKPILNNPNLRIDLQTGLEYTF